MAKLIIYGATGYTGRLASQYAHNLKLDFIVAGRTEMKVQTLASSLNVPFRIFDITDALIIDENIKEASVLLNCAGPFLRTAQPLIEACILNRVHYLDISAELDSYRLSEEKTQDAREANVMLLPGCGGSVAMLGCLVGYVLENAINPVSIDIALHVAGPMSRGSAMTAAENLSPKCLQLFDGQLVDQDSDLVREFDFDDGKGSVPCFAVTLPDLITLRRSTKVANIRTFIHIGADDTFPAANLESLPEGPTYEQMQANPYHVSTVITDSKGNITRAVLHTVNGYRFTSLASVEAARRVLTGEFAAGFQTPLLLFGHQFGKSLADLQCQFNLL